MPSSLKRYDIVVQALTRAGRGVELRSLAETMLNTMLRQWASEYKYPILRKTGSKITLLAGSQYLDLPSDMGAGMDNCLVSLNGTQQTPIYDTMPDEFYQKFGLKGTLGHSQGRPSCFMVDNQLNRLIFDQIADQNYDIIPIYYYLPANLPSEDSAADESKLWMPDDELIIQGLIAKIYQYNQDVREKEQIQYVESLKGNYRRGSVPPAGGTSRVMLSRKRFKNRIR